MDNPQCLSHVKYPPPRTTSPAGHLNESYTKLPTYHFGIHPLRLRFPRNSNSPTNGPCIKSRVRPPISLQRTTEVPFHLLRNGIRTAINTISRALSPYQREIFPRGRSLGAPTADRTPDIRWPLHDLAEHARNSMDVIVAVKGPHTGVIRFDGEDVGDALLNHDGVASRRIISEQGECPISLVRIDDFVVELCGGDVVPCAGELGEDLEVVTVEVHWVIADVGPNDEPVRIAAAFNDNGAAFVDTIAVVAGCGVENVVRNAGL